MPLATPGAPLTVTLAASGYSTTTYVSSVDYTTSTRKFERKEFSNQFLMNLSESDGSFPIFIKNAVGKPVQLNFNCGNYTARSILPDDANANSILRKFVVRTYTIQGAPSAPSAVNILATIAQDHQERLASFDAYQDKHSLANSYLYFFGMRNFTFSYLTTTGLTLSGGELMSETNCLIRSFSNGITHTNPTNSTITTKDWKLEVDILTLEAADIYN